MSPQSSSGSASNQTNVHTFEFTKRKKYADLLIAELTEAIVLVLSSECKILFCGSAVTDLLGWRDEDLVDSDLIELINDADRPNFRCTFNESLRTRNELLCYVRLKCKSHYSAAENHDPRPQEVLFEFKGHPHFIADTFPSPCFFAVAKPYPSRNTAMLNTFLELKMDNERLQQRLSELRKQAPKSLSTITPAGYGPLMQPSWSYPSLTTIPNQRSGEMTQPYHVMSAANVGRYGSMMPSSSTLDGSTITPYEAMYTLNPAMDEDTSEDGSRKKKPKKLHVNEQHVCVTCGRTDSPEWRKGPQGPKTLCNACGLRWAKLQRKTDDGNDVAGAGETQTQVSSSAEVNLLGLL